MLQQLGDISELNVKSFNLFSFRNNFLSVRRQQGYLMLVYDMRKIKVTGLYSARLTVENYDGSSAEYLIDISIIGNVISETKSHE